MAHNSCCVLYNRKFGSTYSLLLGIILGFLAASQLRYVVLQQQIKCSLSSIRQKFVVSEEESLASSERAEFARKIAANISGLTDDRKLIFIGVMTAQKYLDNRAKAIHDTWGQNVPGKLVFFSSSSSRTNLSIPLLPLPSVDDSYPPQKKSFLMLKYMHDNFLHEFEWFMRADDDVYIRTERLEKFLRSVNSSKPQFIGQAGVGNKDEFGQLSLQPDENFCMGGPGMIMSRDTLRLVVPHIRYCLKNLYSTHEDVEVGRCVRKFVGIPCTWSYEMQSIFYHSFSGEEVFTGRLKKKEVHRAITLHPIKHAPYMYRLHSYFYGLETQNLRYRNIHLYREILDMKNLLGDAKLLSDVEQTLHVNTSIFGKKPLLNKFHPNNKDEVLVWDFICKSVFSADAINPKHRLESFQQIALNDVVMEVMEMINKYSKQRGRVIDFKEILYGYVRENPLYGVEYILDILLTYRKYKGKKMTVPVRRHAYLQKAFSQPEFRQVSSKSDRGGKTDVHSEYVNIVLPLSGRTENFKRFLSNIEEVCLQNDEKVRLTVVYFVGESSNDRDMVNEARLILEDLKNRYPSYDLLFLEENGAFSRAVALETGSKSFSMDSLLLFLDVDIILSFGVMERVRLNTVKGKQAYFPVVFSEYDLSFADIRPDTPPLSEERGYWRQFGYGIVSIYHCDLRDVGGLDTSIKGWGKEDVDLFAKVVRSNMTVFRTADPGMIHKFHPIICSSQLETFQYEMCWGSKLSSLASQKRLGDIILSNKDRYLNKRR